MTRLLLFSVCATIILPITECVAQTFGPIPYRSFLDSPFFARPVINFHLEDFEDGALNTPGVTVEPGTVVTAPGSATDSVDGDDGALDGNGQNGRSLYSNSAAGPMSKFTFEFDAAALGGEFPTLVGIVWTDVGNVTSGETYAGPVTVEAFDPSSTSIAVIGPVTVGGDGTVEGLTAEDRFFGFSHVPGIARLEISMSNSTDWEIDHLQYGLPEPSTLGIGMLVLIGLTARRR